MDRLDEVKINLELQRFSNEIEKMHQARQQWEDDHEQRWADHDQRHIHWKLVCALTAIAILVNGLSPLWK